MRERPTMNRDSGEDRGLRADPALSREPDAGSEPRTPWTTTQAKGTHLTGWATQAAPGSVYLAGR